MYWECKHHGENRPRRWVSVTIRDAIKNNAPLTLYVRPILVVHPDKSMEVDICFVDEIDYRIFAEYVASQPTALDNCYPILSLLRRTLPASTIVLVSRDRERRRLNDRVFLVKVTKRLGPACAECLRTAQRAVGQPTDLDFDIPGLSQSYYTGVFRFIS